MASEGSARELMAEYDGDPQLHKGLLGLGPSMAVKDRLAYRLGRGGREVNEHILKAKIASVSDSVTRLILRIKSEFVKLRSQESDLLAHIAYIVAIFFGLTVLVAALLVDYRIIHEFWTRAVMDELGKVPASLKSSVYFKSGQVVFATLAFHFMLETVGEAGRRAFVLFIFALTFAMLLGIGFIVANNWLPAGSQLFGVDLHAAGRAGHDILAQLGLPSTAPAAEAGGSQLASNLNTARTLIFLGSLSMIFVIVTGVGSLALRNAVHNFQKLSGADTNDLGSPGAASLGLRGSRRQQLAQLKVWGERFGIMLETEPQRGKDIDDARREFNQNNGRLAVERRAIIRKGLLDFADSYAVGLHDWQSAFFGASSAAREARARELLQRFGETMEGLMGGYIDEYVASHSVPYLERPDEPPKRAFGRPSLKAVPRDGDERFGTDD